MCLKTVKIWKTILKFEIYISSRIAFTVFEKESRLNRERERDRHKQKCGLLTRAFKRCYFVTESYVFSRHSDTEMKIPGMIFKTELPSVSQTFVFSKNSLRVFCIERWRTKNNDLLVLLRSSLIAIINTSSWDEDKLHGGKKTTTKDRFSLLMVFSDPLSFIALHRLDLFLSFC